MCSSWWNGVAAHEYVVPFLVAEKVEVVCACCKQCHKLTDLTVLKKEATLIIAKLICSFTSLVRMGAFCYL
jgi:hypothetical protein